MQASSASPFDRALHRLKGKDLVLAQNALQLAKEAHSGQTRKDGSPYVEHPIAVATILANWGADAETIAAGLLHDVIEDTDITREAIAKEFGETVAELVEGVTKITETDLLVRQQDNQESSLTLDRKTETLRKLFDVMREDIRALVIKLADRVHNVRTIERLAPDRRVRFAKETLDIYYKLAYHLGMNDVRREFSETCVPIAHPEAGTELMALRTRKMAEVQRLLPAMERDIKKEDRAGAITEIRLEGHSLVSLLHDRLQPDFSEDETVYLVVISADEDGCYAALKNLHALYHPRSALFRDYIATPARSGYRSLHTTVADEKGHLFDVRIRTTAMDEVERLGILRTCFGTSWKGKEFEWLQRSAAFDWATREDSTAFLQALQTDILQESITVVADGREAQIPSNATVLDVVYARYGKRGHHVVGVHRNGAAAFLGDVVHEDDVIVATLDAKEQVRFEWLGFATTAYARTLIVEALKKHSREEKIAIGRDLLQKEFDHYRKGFIGDLGRAQQEQIAQHFDRTRLEDVLVMIGEGVLSSHDAMLALMPEKRSKDERGRREYAKRFQLQVSGANIGQQEILPRLASVAEQSHVDIQETHMRFNERTGSYGAIVRGRATQKQLADFLSALDRAEWTSNVYMMLSQAQRIALGMRFVIAGAVVAIDILLMPVYAQLRDAGGPLASVFFEILPLLPIIGVNYHLLQLLRQYSARMRQERWFVGLTTLIHVLGLGLILGLSARTQAPGVLPLVATLIGSMVYLTYRFFQTESQFTEVKQGRAPTTAEWRIIRRRKIIGYTCRLFAVIIWGIQPLYLKYTPAAEISPFVRVFLMSAGIVLVSALLFFFTKMRGYAIGQKVPRLQIRWNKEFFGILIGASLFTYFLNASLIFTTSTNFILFNNFSPVLALLVAALLWRQSIPYLKDPQHLLWIFIIFVLGSAGSSLILYNSIRSPNTGTILGDIFGVIAMIVDTLYVISQIRYMKVVKNASAFSINIHIFSLIAITLLPFMGYLYMTGSPVVQLSLMTLLWGLGAGVLSGIGQILNYETFRRVDGFIAFLMFNLAILITFLIEVYGLGTFIPSWIMLLGGGIIIGSSISAEVLNSRCERKGL